MRRIPARGLGVDGIEFAWVEENEVDQEKQAAILSAYVSAGILTVNEARERLGEEPSNDPSASALRQADVAKPATNIRVQE